MPLAFALAVGTSSGRAFARETWPPKTPPIVPGTVPGVAPATPPSAAPTPPPETPPAAPVEPFAAAPVPAPAEAETPQAASPPAGSSGDTTVVAVLPTPSANKRLEAGLSENRLYLRTPGNEVVLFPGGLLELDGRSFHTSNDDAPNDDLRVARGRLELTGLVADRVGFNAAVDVSSGASVRNVDNYVAVAPWRDRAILQAGRFDAPFTMENRISDRGLDFLERASLARTFAIPENKKTGVMVHGTNDARNYYYSAGGFFGDGETDGMGRAWIAPFSFGRGPVLLRDATIGGSAWLGQVRSGSALAPQTTQNGYAILETSTKWFDGTNITNVALESRGTLTAFAAEVNVPIRHKLGVRFEWATKDQPLETVSVTNGGMPAKHGGMDLSGWATYGELSYWVLGDDRVVGEPGLQLPTRLGTLGLPRGFRSLLGAQLVARVEHLEETLDAGPDPTAAADVVSAGHTKLTTVMAGANVWLARRVRASFNYAWNRPYGNTLFLTRLTDDNIHELSFRLALVL